VTVPADAGAGPHPPAMRRALGWIAGRSSVRKVAMSTPFVRDVAWRFVAGEDLAAGLSAVRALNARGIEATLNCVGTHVTDRAAARAATDEVLAALDGIREAGVRSHLSLKLTQIGLDIDRGVCRANLWLILERAHDRGIFVRIDMEESRYVQATLDLFEEARAAFGSAGVGIVLQSYLRDRRDDVARLGAAGARIRLVKGGYWEPPGVVLVGKRAIDSAFAADIETLMAGAVEPAIATHDPAAIEIVRRTTAAGGRDRSSLELQMLMGVRPDLQDRLVREGFRVRCYVPYGGQWYTYVLGCLRRVPGGLAQRARERARARLPGGPDLPAGAAPGRHGMRGKRILDIAGALAGLLVLAPVLASVASVATGGRSRSSSSGRCDRCRPARSGSAPMPGGSRAWGSSSARPVSTSCPSCGTWSAAT
jgi:proline dehydrogenase